MAPASAERPPKTVSPMAEQMRRLRGNRNAMIGGGLLCLVLALALIGPLLTPHDPYVQNLTARRIPPVWFDWLGWSDKSSWTHPLGTDGLGRDYLARLLYGARISILIGLTATLVSGVIGTVLGLLGGYFGGRVDMVISFLITMRLSLPISLVALSVVAIFGGALINVVLVLGLLLWDRVAVVVRAATQQVRELDYVSSAWAVGFGHGYILFREVLPNVINPLLVVLTIEMSHAILLEAGLSFLGMGVQAPMPSWGLMLSEAKSEIFFNAWMVTLPGLAIFSLVLSINLLGDGLRDVLTPEGR
ncbi:ABC transporter permease [Salipiger abyssi]|uniref:ABC transporter permease n=1 Tax=Salipiger abyssi TaxID=1250539 RepID=UPI001A8D1DE2|nr:ABC transporter permease [Salipiger abyssi]